MTTSLKFLAAARISEIPPISIFSMMALIGTRSYGLFEGIEIDDNQVDFGNFIFGDLLTVALFFTTVEYTAENFRVKRFYTATQYRGITRETFYTAARYAQRLNKSLRTTGRNKRHALGMQFFQDFVQTVFVINRD